MRAGMTYIGVLLWVVFLFPADAFAYLDPATGTAIVQGLLALLGALLVGIRIFWNRILMFFRLRTSPREK